MPNWNKAFLMGHLTRDAELTYTNDGNPMLKFDIAYNEEWTRNDGETVKRVHFFKCVMFGKRAEPLSRYLKKGNPILVEGKLQQETWDDKETGKKREAVKINVSNVELLPREGKREEKQEQEQEQHTSAPTPSAPTQQAAQSPPAAQSAGDNYYDEDIPF